MKRSRAVPLTLVASATALAACSRSESMQCVDRGTGRVVAESLCTATNAPTATTPAAGTTTGHAGGIPPIFLWYYGGRVLNGLVSGGAYAPLAGRSYRSPGGYGYDRRNGLAYVGGAGARAGAGAVRGGRSTPTARGGFGGIGAGRAVGG